MMDREFTKKNTSLAISELDKELSFIECKEGSSGDKDKEDVVNKVTAWSSPVNDIHYPSEKLVKDNLDLKEDKSNKVTGWVNDVDNNQYPSAKLVKESLDNLNVNVVQMDIPEPGCSRSYAIKQGNVVLLPKINIPEQGIVVDDHLDSVSVNPVQNKVIHDAIPSKTSDIINDGADGTHPFISDVSDKEDKSNKVGSVDVFSSDEQYPSAKALFEEVSKLGLSIEKQGTAEDGFASTYVFSQGGVELPTKINIPKDSFFKSVTVRVCEERGVPLPELYVGDKYIDFLVATVDGSDTHLYLAARNFLFVPDELSLTVNESGVMSVKANGVGPSRLMDGAVGYEKLNHNLIGDSLTIDNEKCLLTARQGKLLNDKKIDKSDIIDDLESDAPTHVLSARQGNVLDEKKIDKISIVDDLTSDDSFKVLSAKQGKVLETNKIDKGSIVDNLTTDDSSKVLSARQGKILYDLISGIEEDMLL